ncbi:hypothetical protein EYF80_002534 [Liparis tanakae]|uniref:Uncharacterized protein n=1 Tax=Liparis tanakae TaxID=230148 RepID=A0A4Z2JC47_9TELE|nr:hypothetical protein EYF80_002534 [Liparis tanakae]
MSRLSPTYTLTSSVAAKAILNDPWTSLVKTLWKVCLNREVLKESAITMSCQDLMGVFSSSPTTMPGPCVAGPPMKVMTRAPVLGKVHWGLKQIVSDLKPPSRCC